LNPLISCLQKQNTAVSSWEHKSPKKRNPYRCHCKFRAWKQYRELIKERRGGGKKKKVPSVCGNSDCIAFFHNLGFIFLFVEYHLCLSLQHVICFFSYWMVVWRRSFSRRNFLCEKQNEKIENGGKENIFFRGNNFIRVILAKECFSVMPPASPQNSSITSPVGVVIGLTDPASLMLIRQILC